MCDKTDVGMLVGVPYIWNLWIAEQKSKDNSATANVNMNAKSMATINCQNLYFGWFSCYLPPHTSRCQRLTVIHHGGFAPNKFCMFLPFQEEEMLSLAKNFCNRPVATFHIKTKTALPSQYLQLFCLTNTKQTGFFYEILTEAREA